MKPLYTPVILCGGSGTRLWPASRKALPKQFISLDSDNLTLFQQTLQRLQKLTAAASPIVICSESHRFLVAEQLRQIDCKATAILLEPMARNTAAAIAVAACWIAQTPHLKNSQMLVFPADHKIKNHAALIAACEKSRPSSIAGQLTVFGVTPTHPETGYGYIEKGSKDPITGNYWVNRFEEKPPLNIAEQYCTNGKHYWNSGIFAFTADSYIKAASAHAPDVLTNAQNSVVQAQADLDFIRLEPTSFAKCPDISIDYAILEHIPNIQMTLLNADWSDVGAWSSVASLAAPDEQGNKAHGEALFTDCNNCYVNSEDRTVVLLGVNDLVVIEREDALLVTTHNQSQNVRAVVSRLQQLNNPAADSHPQAHRPWGSYRSIDNGNGFQVKHITVLPGRKLSLQKHSHRAEHWVVVNGTAKVTCDQSTLTLEKNQSTYIPLGSVHRLENIGDKPLELIEVQSGDYLGEDDIVRLEDHYGRVSSLNRRSADSKL